MKTDESNSSQEDAACMPLQTAVETVADNPVTEPDDPRVMSAVRYFRIVVRSIQAHSAWVERQCGVSAAQLWALWEIDRAPGMNVTEIARRLSIKPATASNLLDKVENKQLVRRERAGPDQRVVQLFVTEPGMHLLDTAPLPAQGALLDGLTRLGEGELNKLNDSLEALVEILRVKDEGSALSPMPPGKS